MAPKSAEDTSTPETAPYVVLARKYRPQNFSDLIGQDAMVATLKNAFATGRIAQGYMLTGVRGVGKTTTARILARALNYEPGDAADGAAPGPTVDMPELGVHCAEIMESRHADVVEMDAASNTGVDNVREIIESARYKPLVARYKVFIIDEVHMLSKGAFNALLKTLEEPPEHVKFIFATTEIRKVPVTVLSRCQRFDLRRVDVPELKAHFQRIVGEEGAKADDEALALIARAAEGSVRDGLSILDQAIAFGKGAVDAGGVRDMLGLADRGRIFDLLDSLFAGDVKAALAQLSDLRRDGAEPARVLADLAEATHLATRQKAVGADAGGLVLSAEEKRRADTLAEALSMPLLGRAWQVLLKGLDEVGRAPNPHAAAEMVLIRMAHMADLPTPDQVIKAIGAGAAQASTPPLPPPGKSERRDAPQPTSAGRPDRAERPADAQLIGPATFDDVIALAGEKRDARLKFNLEEYASLVAYDPVAGSIDVHLIDGAPKELANDLREKLNKWTGGRWIIALSPNPGKETAANRRRAYEAKRRAEVSNHPAVKALFEAFPDAEIAEIVDRPEAASDAASKKDDDSATG